MSSLGQGRKTLHPTGSSSVARDKLEGEGTLTGEVSVKKFHYLLVT